MASSTLLLLALATAPVHSPTASPATIASEAAIGAVRAAARVDSATVPAEGTAPRITRGVDGLRARGAASALFTQGVEALKAKDFPTAISALSECTRLVPERVDCRWELGWAYSMEGRWREALEQWTEVERLEPSHPDLVDALEQARAQVRLQAKLAEAPSSATRPPPPANATVRIRAVGDVMLGTDFPEGYLPPDGPDSVLAGVRAQLQDADLTFINLEGPLCDNGTTKKCRKGGNCYAFRSPTSYARTLAEAGVDLASTANNHSGDFGESCRRETEAALDAHGIRWSGPPGTIATVERNGLRIAMVAFHTSPACNHLNDHDTATALVRTAAASHDLVIVSFHGGAEGSKALHVPHGKELFLGEDRGDLRTFTHAVVDAGADLVLGHGPHVVRGVELYKDRLIAYSLGNFATYGRFNLKGPQGLGMILEAELDAEGRFRAGRLIPTRQEDKGLAVVDPDAAVLPLVRQLTEADFPEWGVHVAGDGTLWPRGKAPVSASPSAP